MSNRVVMVDDLLALIEEAKRWIGNRLANGAGTREVSTSTTSESKVVSDTIPGPKTDSTFAAVAIGGSPSAGTTASGAGSVAAAVEALRAALADNMGVYLAAKQLLALDVPGMLAARERGEQEAADMVNIERTDRMKAESDAAKLRAELAKAEAESNADAHYVKVKHSEEVANLRDCLAASERRARNFESSFREMAENCNRAHESLRVEREACDAYRKGHTHCQERAYVGGIFSTDGTSRIDYADKRCSHCKETDTRRAAEKNSGGSDAASRSQPDRSQAGGNPAPPTNNAPVQVTDEDRRIAGGWIDEHCLPAWKTERLARLIAKVRQDMGVAAKELEAVNRMLSEMVDQRDDVIRELVEALRQLVDRSNPSIPDKETRNVARALVKKHGGAA